MHELGIILTFPILKMMGLCWYILVLFEQHFTEKTVDLSRIRTRIVWSRRASMLTTRPPQRLNYSFTFSFAFSISLPSLVQFCLSLCFLKIFLSHSVPTCQHLFLFRLYLTHDLYRYFRTKTHDCQNPIVVNFKLARKKCKNGSPQLTASL